MPGRPGTDQERNRDASQVQLPLDSDSQDREDIGMNVSDFEYGSDYA